MVHEFPFEFPTAQRSSNQIIGNNATQHDGINLLIFDN